MLTMSSPPVVSAQPLAGRSAYVLIINSVENFQIVPKTLMESSSAGVKADSSTTKTSTAAKRSAKSAELENAPLPTAQRLSSVASVSSSTAKPIVIAAPPRPRPLPEGVVPVPPNEMLSEERRQAEVKTEAPKTKPENQANNRYANVVDEVQAQDGAGGGDEQKAGDSVADLPAVSEVDNAAHEVMDNNEFLVDGHKDHLQAVLDDVKLSGNNAAEVDANGFDGKRHDEQDDQNEVDNAILSGVGVGNAGAGDLMARRLAHGNKLANEQKLLHEIDADDGKVAGYPEDIHLEENNEEEEDGKLRRS